MRNVRIHIQIYDEKGIICEGNSSIRNLETDEQGQVDIAALIKLLSKITEAAR